MKFLENKFCLFSRLNHTQERFFQLVKDGEILDINNPGHNNERYWDAHGECLTLYNDFNIRTSKFHLNKEKSMEYDNKYLYFEGKNDNNLQLLIVACDNIEDLEELRKSFTAS